MAHMVLNFSAMYYNSLFFFDRLLLNIASYVTIIENLSCNRASEKLFKRHKYLEGENKVHWAKFLNRHRSKRIWVINLFFCQNDSPVGIAWSLIYFLNYAYLEIWPSILFSPHPLVEDTYPVPYQLTLSNWFR